MNNAEYSYHESLTYDFKNTKIKIQTQLYNIGIYCIIQPDNIQLSLQPQDLIKAEREFIKLQQKGDISNLKFGTLITIVFDENGFLKEKI